MRNAFRIFRRDMGRLLRNPAALLVIIGVSIIPSLYAWFNIAANIDPYANTSGIKVAVANNDKDASSNDLEINAGDEIISNLKENDQLGWTFVDEEQAIEGVKSGEYYAAIVIPEDFSSSLLSILSGELKTPELEYYINEKANAIAPKITSSGASAIQSQINSTFSSIAAESVSDILKDAVSDVADSVGRVNSDINEMLEKANDNIKEYEDLLGNFGSHSIDTHDLIENAGHAANSLNKAAKAAVETVAENASDGVIAPMIFIAIGGAPLGFFYKAVNTMDSMVGYKNGKYLYFGRAAAKLDDVMNYVPSRISGLLMVASSAFTSGNAKGAWRIFRRDRYNHASPNSAQTEAACAGALGLQLAGDAWYFGERYHKPTIGDPRRDIEDADIIRANCLMYGASILCLVLCVVIRYILVG